MPKGLRRALAALLFAPLLYALLGFVLLPWAGLKLINQQLAEHLQVPARLERIEFNPFSLELSLLDLQVGEPGAEQLGFARLYADLQLDSLWRGELHLRELRLEQPRVELRLDTDGRLNLTQLLRLPPRDSAPTEATDAPVPLRLARATLSGGALRFVDLRQQPVVEHRYDRLELSLSGLTTRGGEDSELSLSASGPHGAALDCQGRLGLQPLRSSGHLSLGATDLTRWWPYLQPLLPYRLQSGTLSLGSDYRLDAGDALRLQLSEPRLQLSALGVSEADGQPLLELDALELGASRLELRGGPRLQVQLDGGRGQAGGLRLFDPDRQPRLRLADLAIADTRLDLDGRRLEIGSLHSRGLETRAAREVDGRIDWQALLERQLAALQAHRPDAEAHSAETPPGSPWHLQVEKVQLRDWRARLEDRQPSPAVALTLGPLDLDLHDLNGDASQPLGLRLVSALGANGRLEVAGQLTLAPLAGRLAVQARELDLRLAQAYLAPFAHLELRSGLLGADLAIDLQSLAPLRFRVSGDADVAQLHTLDTLKGRDFVRWRQLDLAGLDYRHGERLQVERVRLQQPYVRFIVNEDLGTNIQELLIPRSAAAQTAEAGPPLQLRIGGIEIEDGSANFADFSLRPVFATAVQQLQGRIGTLDNRSAQPATVKVHGKVDRYAPVSIEGRLTPFAPLEQLDIATRFQRVELTTLTPYAGKFAGYKIRKGRLNLDLHYRIEKGRLEADNRLLLEDLQLGERVDSPSATDLPVRLAVALLKDGRGNIDIALPVSGDLNDPRFSVAPIVWQTLRNLLLRTVQAPFKLLAGLAEGNAQPLDSVPFAAGSSELDEQARTTLARLATALQHKAGLRLEVEGMSLAALDGPPLAEQRLQREYRETWYRMLQRRGERVPAEPALLEVPEEMKTALLEGIYRSRLGQQPPPEWRALDTPERSERLRQAVLDDWAASNALQRRLAQDRARAIKAWLVEQGGLADERIYLLEVGSAIDAAGPIGVPLHLSSE
ncbi:DUF748 domain-containing protein [Pseudomonas stutzeri]|nr:DUF748 domain-containing protein [Stutzerimonas stutzeri]